VVDVDQVETHQVLGAIAATVFAVFIAFGVRVWRETHQVFSGAWTFPRYVIAGWVLWSLGMFLLASAVASLPTRNGPGK
jgi:hypothetical protein